MTDALAMNEHLRLETDGAIARLLIDRAAKRNAFSQAMWEAFPALVDAAMADPGVKLLIVASAAGGPFCAGADIGEFATASSDPDWRKRNQAAIRATQVTLARAPKPTLAVVEGDCIGGGCGIALACDMRVATPAARFGITPAKLGLVYPLHDTKLLVDVVGPSQAKRMLYTGMIMSAAEAARIGLVDVLTEDLSATLHEIGSAIAGTSGHSHRETKVNVRAILDGATDDDPGTSARFDAAFTGADFKEGVAAFLEKRKPRFS
jgi:enoyl-CoA hydratase/carnithine racemase